MFKNQVNNNIEKIFLGFSAGVMIAASVWSLIIPSLDCFEEGSLKGCCICCLGIIGGITFLILTNKFLNIEMVKDNMLALAITLHNIPEGMAVGVAFAQVLNGENMMIAFPLAIGIAIQNIPEGATISLPFKAKGVNSKKAFWYGALSGIVEPIFATITLIISSFIQSILPFLLSFAAGAMLFVVSEELIPEVQKNKNSNIGTIAIMIGFILMMALDNLV